MLGQQLLETIGGTWPSNNDSDGWIWKVGKDRTYIINVVYNLLHIYRRLGGGSRIL